MATKRIALTAAEASLATVAVFRMLAYLDWQSFQHSHRDPSQERLLT